MQQAFDRKCALMAASTLVAYLNPNKLFHNYPDASDFWFDLCIGQDGQPVAYFSHNQSK